MLSPPLRIEFVPTGTDWPPDVVASIERPLPQDLTEAFSIEVRGFVALVNSTPSTCPDSIDFRVLNRTIWSTKINLPRPDVCSHERLKSSAGQPHTNCGFNTTLPTFAMPNAESIDLFVNEKTTSGAGSGRSYRLGTIRLHSVLADSRPFAHGIGIVVVTSIGRSGSSLVCRVLDAHPSCFAPKLQGQFGEVSVFGHYLRAISVLANEGSIASMNRFEGVADFENLPAAYLRMDNDAADHFHRKLMAVSRWGAVELLRNVHNEVTAFTHQQKPGASYWVEKSWNQMSGALAPTFFKHHREIVLVRDIREFWRSQLLFHKKIGGSEEQLLQHAHATYGKYVRLALSYLSRSEDVLLVRYEDLLADPETQFRRIMAHLTLPFPPEFASEMLAIVRGTDQHSQAMSTANEVHSGDLGFDQYLKGMGPEAVKYLRELLQQLGYSLA